MKEESKAEDKGLDKDEDKKWEKVCADQCSDVSVSPKDKYAELTVDDDSQHQPRVGRGAIRLSVLKTIRECLSTSKVVYAAILVFLMIFYEVVR